jgi:hypothetical protein
MRSIARHRTKEQRSGATIETRRDVYLQGEAKTSTGGRTEGDDRTVEATAD